MMCNRTNSFLPFIIFRPYSVILISIISTIFLLTNILPPSCAYGQNDLWLEFAHPNTDLHSYFFGNMYVTIPEMFSTPPPSDVVRRPLLVILMEFPDQLHRTVHDPPFWDDMIFGTHLASDPPSVTQIISSSMNGLVQIAPATIGDQDGNPDGIIGWVSSSINASDSFWDDNGAEKARAEAIRLADQFFDYSLYDSNDDGIISYDELTIYVIFSSPETCDVHQDPGHPIVPCTSSNPGIARVTYPDYVPVEDDALDVHLYVGGGAAAVTTHDVIAHEFGHTTFGLGDLYIADGCPGYQVLWDGYWCDDNGWYPPSPGRYALMDNPSNVHSTPMTPWAKIHLGVTRPKVIVSDGIYTLFDVETERNLSEQASESEAFIIYDPLKPNPYKSYFILENRTQNWVISDPNCPTGNNNLLDQGLLVWLIDENENLFRKMIRLVRHNGYWPVTCPEDSAWDGGEADYYDFTSTSFPRNSNWADGTSSHVEIYDVSPANDTITFKVRMTPLFVDIGYGGLELGTYSQPFDTIQEAIAAIPVPPRTVDIKGGNYPGQNITINSPCTLRAWGTETVIIGNN